MTPKAGQIWKRASPHNYTAEIVKVVNNEVFYISNYGIEHNETLDNFIEHFNSRIICNIENDIEEKIQKIRESL